MLAPIFKKLGIIEKWGNGLKLIHEELKKYPEIKFLWLEPGVSFRVVFEITTQETTPKTTSIILQMIKENLKVSIAELIEAIGDITIDGVKYHFRELKKQAKIERIGSSRSGYWKIVK